MKQLFERIFHSDTVDDVMIVLLVVLFIAKGVIDLFIIPNAKNNEVN